MTRSTSTKVCTTYGEEIAASARKCIHCDTWQDWRRYLVFSNTVLALLVALISVATVAAPVFRDMLTTKDSHLIGSFQGVTDNGAVFVIFNSGNRPGTVGEGSILIATRMLPVEILARHLLIAPRYREEAFFVDAGQSRIIKYTRAASESNPPASRQLQCAISINLINFSGNGSEPCFESDCSQLLSVLQPDVKIKTADDYSAQPLRDVLPESCRRG